MNDLHKSIINHVHTNGKNGLLIRNIVLAIEGGIPNQMLTTKYVIASQILVESEYLRYSDITNFYKPGKRTLKKESKKPNKRKPSVQNKTVDKIIKKKEEINMAEEIKFNMMEEVKKILKPCLSSRTTKIMRVIIQELDESSVNQNNYVSEDEFKQHVEEYFTRKSMSGLIQQGQLGTAIYTLENRHIIYRFEGNIYLLSGEKIGNKLIDEIEAGKSNGYFHAGVPMKKSIFTSSDSPKLEIEEELDIPAFLRRDVVSDEDMKEAEEMEFTENKEKFVEFHMSLNSSTLIREINVKGHVESVQIILDSVMDSIAKKLSEAA